MKFIPNPGNLLVKIEVQRTNCCVGRVVEPAEFEWHYNIERYSVYLFASAGDLLVFRNDVGTEALMFGEDARIISWSDVLGKAADDA